jgi:hypothetical protein
MTYNVRAYANSSNVHVREKFQAVFAAQLESTVLALEAAAADCATYESTVPASGGCKLGQQPRPQQPRQLPRIPPVRLDMRARPHRDQRRSHDVTHHLLGP